MLIKPNGARTKTLVTLTTAEAQGLVDLEPFFVGLGLSFDLLCIPCRQMHRSPTCVGTHDYDATINADRFSVTCACTERIYRGSDLLVPALPHWAPRAKGLLKYQRTRDLSRATMSALEGSERLLAALKLQYGLRCLQCQTYGEPDGVTGVHASTAMQIVMECRCTKRVYTSADAPATVH